VLKLKIGEQLYLLIGWEYSVYTVVYMLVGWDYPVYTVVYMLVG